MPTAAAYIRVSDDRQDEFSPDSQLSLIKDFCRDRNLTLPKDYIFYDDGISAKTTARRPAFLHMIDLAKAPSHPIDVIVVWKYSRFARNQEESIVIKSMLKKRGVEVLSVSEPISGDPFGSLVERIIEWMDEYYLVRLSSEVRRGMTEKALRGLPNSPPPIGYCLKDGSLTVDEEGAAAVKACFRFFLEGKTIREVADSLNDSGYHTKLGSKFDRRSVAYILHNPIYAGYTRWSKMGRLASDRVFSSDRFIVAKGIHTPLITEEEFASVEFLLATVAKTEENRAKHRHALSGLFFCRECGGAMILRRGKSPFYRCVNRGKGGCQSKSVSASSILESISNAIFACFPTLFKYFEFFAPIASTYPIKSTDLPNLFPTDPPSPNMSTPPFPDQISDEEEINTILAILFERIEYDSTHHQILISLNYHTVTQSLPQ